MVVRGDGSASTPMSVLPNTPIVSYMGTLLIRNRHPPLEPQKDPRHRPTIRSYGVAIFDKRGSHVCQKSSCGRGGACAPKRVLPNTPKASYRGTSLIRKRTPLGPYRRLMPRVLGGS